MKKTKKVTKPQMNKSKSNKNNSSLLQQKEARRQNVEKQNQLVKAIQIEFDDFQEVFEDVNISGCINSTNNSLSLKKLINLLEREFNVFSKDKQIKFYLQQGNVFITVPPIKKALSSMEIDQCDFIHNKILKLQLFKNKQLIDVVMQDSQNQSDQNGDDDDQNQNEQKVMEGKCRRLKQRKIKNVIEKVLKWRELYAGIENGQQKTQRISLEQGAKMVKISKKTLDDYLSQLKKGKKYGFNFNDHKNEKIGVLREFIRKMQKKR